MRVQKSSPISETGEDYLSYEPVRAVRCPPPSGRLAQLGLLPVRFGALEPGGRALPNLRSALERPPSPRPSPATGLHSFFLANPG